MIALFSIGVAAMCLAIWTAVAFRVRGYVRTERPLHLTTVYLVIAWTVGFDIVLILGSLVSSAHITIPGQILMGVFGFVLGIQLVASLSALMFLRRL